MVLLIIILKVNPMRSNIKNIAVLSVDEDFPAQNRLVSPDLDVSQVKISFHGGYCVGTAGDIFTDLSFGNLHLGRPLVVPGCDVGEGNLAYVFQTTELSLWLSPSALIRLVARSLKAQEYFSLRSRYGVFYEISHGFYDSETGIALNPIDLSPEKCLGQFELR